MASENKICNNKIMKFSRHYNDIAIFIRTLVIVTQHCIPFIPEGTISGLKCNLIVATADMTIKGWRSPLDHACTRVHVHVYTCVGVHWRSCARGGGERYRCTSSGAGASS